MSMKYETIYPIRYYSKRYNKYVNLPAKFKSDGATGAIDIDGPVTIKVLDTGVMREASLSWLVHDKLCEDMAWEDGSPCTRWQGSNVIADILKEEGHWIRDSWWKYATYTPKIWNQFKSWF